MSAPDDTPVTITMDTLGLLVLCAVDYSTRLPYGVIPPEVYPLLSETWRERIAQNRDEIGECFCKPCIERRATDKS